jgi:hypothetical protein
MRTLPIIAGGASLEGALGDFGAKICDFAAELGEVAQLRERCLPTLSRSS